MELTLCLDSGNSRIKWGLREGGRWSLQGALAHGALHELENQMPRRPDRIIACNVAGAEAAGAIETLAIALRQPVRWLRAEAARAGVRNGYRQPGQLGADRWAALIGARRLHSEGPVLVVGAGTATTVDLLSGDGCFQGGLILPGLAMMRSALALGTAQLPLAEGQAVAQPRNTADAIVSGSVLATAGAVEKMFQQIAGESQACCLLFGGAVGELLPWLTPPCRVVENLVLEGLASLADPEQAA